MGCRRWGGWPVDGERRQERLGLFLRFRHVGLVKRVDPERRPSDRGRKLPPEEFGSKTVDARAQAQHRVSGRFERREAVLVRRVAVGRNGDEGSIAAVLIGPALDGGCDPASR